MSGSGVVFESMASTLLFSTFEVSRQAFFRTATTAAIVNLKPLVPGHVLVIPTRVVSRVSDLTNDEVSSLFSAVQTVGKDLYISDQNLYNYRMAKLQARDKFSNNDDVYPELETHEQRMHKDMTHLSKKDGHETGTPSSESSVSSDRSTFRVDNESRKPRTMQEMEEEANWLKSLMPTEDAN
ncbi:6563_t:CDS:2 [Acaulospora colombiana]|uniref:6563_t:CDS:1 n=1 Tax=Acaulospora colombiana TaxID=27376 RepID=A0ACA9PWU7_9GLOM|nr:6563_t:CDS:2 [Acaulospora colombiana]